MNKIKCQNCQAEVNDTDKFCTNCGNIIQIENLCPECNNINSIDAKFCNSCGYNLSNLNNIRKDIQDNEAEASIFYQIDGVIYGGISYKEFKELCSKETITKNTLISIDNKKTWQWASIDQDIISNSHSEELKYYYQGNNVIQGGFSTKEFKELCSKGTITKNTLISTDNKKTWQ